jgi:hypothetical protein
MNALKPDRRMSGQEDAVEGAHRGDGISGW